MREKEKKKCRAFSRSRQSPVGRVKARKKILREAPQRRKKKDKQKSSWKKGTVI